MRLLRGVKNVWVHAISQGGGSRGSGRLLGGPDKYDIQSSQILSINVC